MEMLERYLTAIRKFLPWQRQDDIIAELRANMESQLEDAEAERGRALTEAEVEEWLKKMGPPIVVASRYQPQRSLIGPALFPMYWYVLRLALLWAFLANMIVVAVQTGAGQAGLEAMGRVPIVLMWVAAWITLAFAAVEFAAERYPEICKSQHWIYGKWSPASLPGLEETAAGGGRSRSYFKAVADVVFGILFLAWLLLIPYHPVLLFGPGLRGMQESPYALAPPWWRFYWIVIGLNVVQLAWKCIDLLRGTWQRVSAAQQIVTKGFSLLALAVLLGSSHRVLVVLKNQVADRAQYGATLNGINRGMSLALSITCMVVAVQIGWEVICLVRDRQQR